MDRLKKLELRVRKIEKRNARVEAEKAWETSIMRKFLLSIFTYLAVFSYLAAINVPRPLLHAIVPTVGFLLSTLTLPFFKRMWMRYIYRR